MAKLISMMPNIVAPIWCPKQIRQFIAMKMIKPSHYYKLKINEYEKKGLAIFILQTRLATSIRTSIQNLIFLINFRRTRI